MNVVAGAKLAAGSGIPDIDLHDIRQKSFVRGVYAAVDEAAERELNRLYLKEGVTPTCRPGCCYCCGQFILTNIEEARTLMHYINSEFSKARIEALRVRTQKWHTWDATRRQDASDPFSDDHYCPLLVNGQCSAYPVRPITCRTHFVCSEPPACRPFYGSKSIEDAPLALTTVISATSPFSRRIRDRIERSGFNYNDSIMLLPHWLAIEMNWDFAGSYLSSPAGITPEH